jgi:hypothetical protein
MIKPTAVFFFFLRIPLAAHFHASFVVRPFARRVTAPPFFERPGPARALLCGPIFRLKFHFFTLIFESLFVHAIELTQRS